MSKHDQWGMEILLDPYHSADNSESAPTPQELETRKTFKTQVTKIPTHAHHR